MRKNIIVRTDFGEFYAAHTNLERRFDEGFAEGEVKVTAIFNVRDENIIINWIQKDKPIPEVKSLAADLGISDERLAELLKK